MPLVDQLVRDGDLVEAARVAQASGQYRRASELLALAGHPAEAVSLAQAHGDWRTALDLALAADDERLVYALCAEIGEDPAVAVEAAAHARIAHRIDVAARLLEPALPAEAARAWYEHAEHLRAARCFDRAGEQARAIVAYEQHVGHAPDDTSAAIRLAELRALGGDDAGAVRALQQAVMHAESDREALARLVAALVRVGLDGSARVVARRLRALDPTASLDPAEYRDRLPRPERAARLYAGRYRVVREAASGATGRVLEAVDELTGEPVALKVLSVSDDRGGAFARFVREAELAKALDDPTLVHLRALDPDGPTLVYDWMPGGTLAQRIGQLRVGEVRAIALQLLAALEVLHRHGVVHRDVKPSNVLFDPAGRARLGDLGAAHLGDLGATVTGGLVGSLAYMAPEQITGADVHASTDLYAFGCVLFQMLTGSLPFAGPDFVADHLAGEPRRASLVRPALGTAYDPLLAQLLARDPESRPSDAPTVRRALATLPWTEPDDAGVQSPRISIAPPGPSDADDARFVLATEGEGWVDTQLGRRVARVVFATEPPWLARWIASESSALQCVHAVVRDEGLTTVYADWIDGDAVLEASARALVAKPLADIGCDATVQVRRSARWGVVAVLPGG